MNNDIQIKLLKDCQDHIPYLAQLWYQEISSHWVPGATVEKAKERLAAHMNGDKLPMAFVAVQNDQPIGMGCLRETDGIQPSLTPWLGSLVVDPKYRGRKVGEALIDSIKIKAKSFGHEKIYLLAFDATIPEWYERLGWKQMSNDNLFGHSVIVMNINI